MESNTYLIKCTNPLEYLNSLQALGNKKQKLWNGFEIVTKTSNAKVNCQIFIKNDLHFYRTDALVEDAITFKMRKEATDTHYIDFRINKFGSTVSMIEDKELRLCPTHKKDTSFHVYLKKELLCLKKGVLETKRKYAHQSALLNKINREILAIPATGNKNALRVEGKMLELSYAYLEYLHAPLKSPPSFLSSDYKLQCIYNAKIILKDSFVNPPTIKELSKKVGINCNQLKIGFKYLFDTTIRQYVINLRLDNAQQMIQKTQLPLGVICHKVGYTNHGHFSKLYKEKFGLSPLQDRGVLDCQNLQNSQSLQE